MDFGLERQNPKETFTILLQRIIDRSKKESCKNMSSSDPHQLIQTKSFRLRRVLTREGKNEDQQNHRERYFLRKPTLVGVNLTRFSCIGSLSNDELALRKVSS